ncbi:MAG: 30S ribosome-binding factor RbfA [Phycisphaerae bacterium]|nr:30S ribosome-binding factor RbfA [Phycisphaerae bacterium]
MPRRTERVSSLIRTIIAEAIQTRLSDPRIPPITSITRVEVSADFSVARVFVSVLATDVEDEARRKIKRELCLSALRSASGYLRRLLGRELTLRKTPVLDFQLDESVQGSIETIQLIDRVMEELDAEAEPATLDEQDDPEAPPASKRMDLS